MSVNVLTFASVHWSVCSGGSGGCVLIEPANGDYVDHPSTRPNNRLSSLPSVIGCDCDCDYNESENDRVPRNNCDRVNHASTSRNGDVNGQVWSDRHHEQVPAP